MQFGTLGCGHYAINLSLLGFLIYYIVPFSFNIYHLSISQVPEPVRLSSRKMLYNWILPTLTQWHWTRQKMFWSSSMPHVRFFIVIILLQTLSHGAEIVLHVFLFSRVWPL